MNERTEVLKTLEYALPYLRFCCLKRRSPSPIVGEYDVTDVSLHDDDCKVADLIRFVHAALDEKERRVRYQRALHELSHMIFRNEPLLATKSGWSCRFKEILERHDVHPMPDPDMEEASHEAMKRGDYVSGKELLKKLREPSMQVSIHREPPEDFKAKFVTDDTVVGFVDEYGILRGLPLPRAIDRKYVTVCNTTMLSREAAGKLAERLQHFSDHGNLTIDQLVVSKSDTPEATPPVDMDEFNSCMQGVMGLIGHWKYRGEYTKATKMLEFLLQYVVPPADPETVERALAEHRRGESITSTEFIKQIRGRESNAVICDDYPEKIDQMQVEEPQCVTDAKRVVALRGPGLSGAGDTGTIIELLNHINDLTVKTKPNAIEEAVKRALEEHKGVESVTKQLAREIRRGKPLPIEIETSFDTQGLDESTSLPEAEIEKFITKMQVAFDCSRNVVATSLFCVLPPGIPDTPRFIEEDEKVIERWKAIDSMPRSAKMFESLLDHIRVQEAKLKLADDLAVCVWIDGGKSPAVKDARKGYGILWRHR